MHGGGRILVILGVVLALIAGAGVYVVIGTATPESAAVQTTKMVIAVQPIPERSEILPDQLMEADWPVTIPTPVGAFAQPTEVAGKISKLPVEPGQPIIEKMLLSKDELKENHSNASLVVEPGYVAIAFPVTASSNVADAIQAGDRVDILGTFTAQPVARSGESTGPPQTASQRILADVLLLQIGPWPSPGAKSEGGAAGTIVTFQLKEQDALVLKYALEKSEGLTLVLRRANEHQLDTLEPVTLEYINKRFGFKFTNTGQ